MRIRSAFASYGREGSPIIAEIPAMFHDPSTHRHPQQNYSPADRKAYELNKASYHLVYRLSLSLSLTFGDELFECFSLFLSMFTPPAAKKVECRVGVANIGKPVILGEESGGRCFLSFGPAQSAPGGIEIPKAANAGADRGCHVGVPRKDI